MSNDTGGLDCSYDWFLTSGYVGAVSSVAAIVLIICSRAYENFFYRLYLYIATSALVLSVCWCVEQAIPIPETDQLGDSVESVFTIISLALICLSSTLVALITCWLSFHVFLMVMCGVTSLKKWPFEIAGFILVLFYRCLLQHLLFVSCILLVCLYAKVLLLLLPCSIFFLHYTLILVSASLE